MQTIAEAFKQVNTAKQERDVLIKDLIEAFIAADTPFHKLTNPKFRMFIQSLAGLHKISHPNSLRRKLAETAQSKLEKIREIIKNKDAYLMIDETPDTVPRNVVNVLVGVLDGKQSF